MKKSILIIGMMMGIIHYCKCQNFPFLVNNINTLVGACSNFNDVLYISGSYADTTHNRLVISGYMAKTNHYHTPFTDFRYISDGDRYDFVTSSVYVKTQFTTGVKFGLLSTGAYEDTFTRNYAVLHIQDTSGEVVLDKRYFMGSGDYAIAPGAAIETNNKDFLIVGKKKYNQLYFIRTDDTGAIKYSKNINVLWGSFGWPHSVVELDSGDFMIAVDDFYDPGTWPPIGADLPIKTILIKTDSTGTEKWRWMDTSNSYSQSHSLQRLSNGNYVSCGKFVSERIYNYVSYDCSVAMWDTNFNLLWEKRINRGLASGGELYDIKELSDGSFITCGFGGETYDSVNYISGGSLIKIDNSGNIIWAKEFRTSRFNSVHDHHVLYDLDVLPNGDIVAVGEINPQSGSEIGQQGWLLRVDSNGCVVDSNWCGYDNIEIEPSYSSGANNILEIYPNPSSEIINLKMSEFESLKIGDTKIEIYDAMGRAILQQKIALSQEQPIGFRHDSLGNDLSLQINISDFNTGLFFVRILDKNNIEIGNSKFVKE